MASTTINSTSDRRSAEETLVQNWWLFTLRGIVGIIFGCIALIFPGPTMLSLVIFFSAYMLVDGIAGIISAVRAIRRKEDRWGLLIFEGLLDIAVGVLAFLWPGITVVAFVWLIAAWAIVSGGLMTAAGFRLNIDHGRWCRHSERNTASVSTKPSYLRLISTPRFKIVRQALCYF
jgi:uncharacterized membrane protein HdeD (DUF308 family)